MPKLNIKNNEMKRKLLPKRIPIIFALLLCLQIVHGQSITVTGTVRSESNTPIQGVTVSASQSAVVFLIF